MKYELLLKILFDIIANGKASATELAQKYSVTKRTIYRYVDSLSLMGIPVYTMRGPAGGIKIMDTYMLPASFMTAEEYELTISGLEAINKDINSEVLRSAISKIRAVDKRNGGTVNFKSGNIIIDEGPWGEVGGNQVKLSAIEKCMTGCKTLKFVYSDRNAKASEREVDPYFLVFKQGMWYLYGYCHLRQDFRLFKISRMETPASTERIFIKKPSENINLDFSSWFKSADSMHCKFNIDPSVKNDVEEWLGLSAVSENEGNLLAEAKLPIEDSLINKILSYGGKIKVISPESLKKAVTEKALEIVKNYK